MRPFTPGIIDYDGPMATHYTTGRALSAQAAETWRLTILPFLPRGNDLRALDLGSGTGRFAAFLADATGARVVGVEPSERMRGLAVADNQRTDVSYVAGSAERIPLNDKSFDVAWMSQVWHHVRDQTACARELRRVLRDGAALFIRNAFASSADGFPDLLHFFPGIIAIFDQLPSIESTIALFEVQGFAVEAQTRVAQQIAANLKEFADRTRLRADTSLALLSDEEFHACQARLDEAALHDPGVPIVERVDLLVFRARPA